MATRDWMSKVHHSCGASFFRWYESYVSYFFCLLWIFFFFCEKKIYLNIVWFCNFAVSHKFSFKSAILTFLLTWDNGLVKFNVWNISQDANYSVRKCHLFSFWWTWKYHFNAALTIVSTRLNNTSLKRHFSQQKTTFYKIIT